MKRLLLALLLTTGFTVVDAADETVVLNNGLSVVLHDSACSNGEVAIVLAMHEFDAAQFKDATIKVPEDTQKEQGIPATVAACYKQIDAEKALLADEFGNGGYISHPTK
jgi:hypothetical protein